MPSSNDLLNQEFAELLDKLPAFKAKSVPSGEFGSLPSAGGNAGSAGAGFPQVPDLLEALDGIHGAPMESDTLAGVPRASSDSTDAPLEIDGGAPPKSESVSPLVGDAGDPSANELNAVDLLTSVGGNPRASPAGDLPETNSIAASDGNLGAVEGPGEGETEMGGLAVEMQTPAMGGRRRRRRNKGKTEAVIEASWFERPDWLPENWEMVIKLRSSGKTAGVRDKYYFEPKSGRRFRSKIEVMKFLDSGSIPTDKSKQKISSSGVQLQDTSVVNLDPDSSTVNANQTPRRLHDSNKTNQLAEQEGAKMADESNIDGSSEPQKEARGVQSSKKGRNTRKSKKLEETKGTQEFESGKVAEAQQSMTEKKVKGGRRPKGAEDLQSKLKRGRRPQVAEDLQSKRTQEFESGKEVEVQQLVIEKRVKRGRRPKAAEDLQSLTGKQQKRSRKSAPLETSKAGIQTSDQEKFETPKETEETQGTPKETKGTQGSEIGNGKKKRGRKSAPKLDPSVLEAYGRELCRKGISIQKGKTIQQ